MGLYDPILKEPKISVNSLNKIKLCLKSVWIELAWQIHMFHY